MNIEEAIHEFDDAVVETAHNGRKIGDYDHVVISSDVSAVLQRWIHDVQKRVEHLEELLSNDECMRLQRRVEELEAAIRLADRQHLDFGRFTTSREVVKAMRRILNDVLKGVDAE